MQTSSRFSPPVRRASCIFQKRRYFPLDHPHCPTLPVACMLIGFTGAKGVTPFLVFCDFTAAAPRNRTRPLTETSWLPRPKRKRPPPSKPPPTPPQPTSHPILCGG